MTASAKIYGPGTQKKEKGKIVRQGMGGFLTPPGHPEHDFSVQINLRKRPENRGGMSLSAAAECEWLDEVTVEGARAALHQWEVNREPVNSPEVIAWIRQVLGYFKGCYANNLTAEDRRWHAGELVIDQCREPMDHPEDHAGVHLIRRYYPEYVPTQEDFNNAKWGS